MVYDGITGKWLYYKINISALKLKKNKINGKTTYILIDNSTLVQSKETQHL